MIAPIRFVATLLAATLVTTPLLAEPAAPTAMVQTADLDLATPSGARMLHQRVQNAVAQVCGSYDIRDLSAAREVADCRTVAMRDADAKIEVALANARSGRALAANQIRAAAPGL